MSIGNLLVLLLPSGIFFFWGCWLLWKQLRQKQRRKACTEPVTAEILTTKCIKLRNSTRYRYTVRYVWNGETYIADFKTTESCGEQRDEIEVFTDPQNPQNMYADYENLMEFADLLLGWILIVISVFCLVGVLFWND
jgi:hypothetical protein